MSRFKIDWTTGLIETTPPEDGARGWTLAVCADWAPLRDQQQALLDDPEVFYGDLLPLIREANISVVNLECVLTDKPHSPILKDGPNLKGPGGAIKALSVVPFHLACLANNHTLDYGPEALADMQQGLHQAGIQTVGAGLNAAQAEAPVFFNVAGCCLAIVNAAEGEEGRSINGGPGVAGLAQDRLVRQVAELKQKADVVVAILHAGREYVPVPPPYIYQTYRAIIASGADLVIGHHPHVPQGIEIYRGGLICYSLGNFVFWNKSSYDYSRKGFIVKAFFTAKSLKQVQLIPYRLTPDRMVLMSGADKAAFLSDLKAASLVLEDPAQVTEAWNAYADNWFNQQGLSQVSYLAHNSSDEWMLLKMALRGLGKRAQTSWRDVFSKKLIRKLHGALNNSTASQTPELGFAGPTDPAVHAVAKLRNKFDTPAHRELYLTALGRAMTGSTGAWPAWVKDLFEKWGIIN